MMEATGLEPVSRASKGTSPLPAAPKHKRPEAMQPGESALLWPTVLGTAYFEHEHEVASLLLHVRDCAAWGAVGTFLMLCG